MHCTSIGTSRTGFTYRLSRLKLRASEKMRGLINKLIKFEIAKFVHEQINNKLPSTFNNYFVKTNFLHDRVTRFAINEQLHIPLYKTKRSQYSIKFSGAKV